MHLPHQLGVLRGAEEDLARAYRIVASGHAAEADVAHLCERLAAQCERHVAALAPFADAYGERASTEPDRLRADLFGDEARSGGFGLLRDLQDLYLLASLCDAGWTLVGQAAQALRDRDLLAVVADAAGETATQLAWLKTRMGVAAPQALVTARD